MVREVNFKGINHAEQGDQHTFLKQVEQGANLFTKILVLRKTIDSSASKYINKHPLQCATFTLLSF